ncbi:hypothetical protein [Streptomyces sp. OP7]|uniref:hypothetical protein n=1 Tax=Streptomyces sp. OP7 TaxID=3142462 RepID=UPI0032E8D589
MTTETATNREDVLSTIQEKVEELTGDGAVHVIDEGPVVLFLTGREDDTTLQEIRDQVRELAKFAETAPIRQDVLKALREKPEGLTRKEIAKRFPEVPYDDMSKILMGLYDEGLVGFDVVTDARRPRWVAQEAS